MAVTSSGTATVTLPTDEQILITREFDAPKHLVYEAWTTPELVKRWWSGQRGEVTSAEIDLRVGGMWRYVMDAAGGFEVAFHGEYREIVPNERIVTTEVFEGMPDASAARHDHIHRSRRAHDPHHAGGPHQQGGPRRPHQLRYGGRHAGGDGRPRAGRDLASLSSLRRAGRGGVASPWPAPRGSGVRVGLHRRPSRRASP